MSPPTWSRLQRFSNLNPRRISFRTGGLITGVIGVLMMPWKLMTDFSSYIFGWLVGYSGLLGPIAGVMIADYFLVRRAHLKLDDLYRRNGIYEYENGINLRAVAALAAGIVVALLGLVIPPLRLLYDYAWFVGFGVSGALYVMLMQRTAISAATPELEGENIMAVTNRYRRSRSAPRAFRDDDAKARIVRDLRNQAGGVLRLSPEIWIEKPASPASRPCARCSRKAFTVSHSV